MQPADTEQQPPSAIAVALDVWIAAGSMANAQEMDYARSDLTHRQEGGPMADVGDCGQCEKRGNRTHVCSKCGTKLCTACANVAGRSGKCPCCGKAAALRPNR